MHIRGLTGTCKRRKNQDKAPAHCLPHLEPRMNLTTTFWNKDLHEAVFKTDEGFCRDMLCKMTGRSNFQPKYDLFSYPNRVVFLFFLFVPTPNQT